MVFGVLQGDKGVTTSLTRASHFKQINIIFVNVQLNVMYENTVIIGI